MSLDAVAEALARLETAHGAPTGGLERGLPDTDVSAVHAWMRHVGMRKGAYKSPTVTLMSRLLGELADAEGWPFNRVAPLRLGYLLGALGFVRHSGASQRGYRVDRECARRLWAALPDVAPEGRRLRRAPTKRPKAGRVDAPLFWRVYRGRRKSSARPLVDSLGRVWPSAHEAARLIPRAHHQQISLAARRGAAAVGLLWRYLTPDEVRLVPADARCGQRYPWLAWGARTLCCPACGVSLAGPEGYAPHQDSPPPPPSESHAGGPTHIRGEISTPPSSPHSVNDDSPCTATVPK
jgi:hypothetical protein